MQSLSLGFSDEVCVASPSADRNMKAKERLEHDVPEDETNIRARYVTTLFQKQLSQVYTAPF